jgi:arsenate reductase (glutaredoxin)
MESRNGKHEPQDDAELEQRQYSSPACYLHEIENAGASAAASAPVTIYHNPSCSKSRETLALIRAGGLEPRIVEYIETPPNEAELAAIVEKLNVAPAELVRTNEQAYKDKYAGKHLSDAEWIKALVADPILLQRPIVVRGNAAVIARPPQNVKRLLG